MHRYQSARVLLAAWVAVVALGSFGLTAHPAGAKETGKTAVAAASPSPTPTPSPSEITELKAQLAEMKARLDLLESQQQATAQQTFSTSEQIAKDKAVAAAVAKSRPPGSGVRIAETSGTDVRLYALLEGTVLGQNHVNKAGAPSIGMPVSWFSGNRWGIEAASKLYTGEDAPNKLSMLAKLESEYELPSGNMDTPGVLFNRDAWIGVESKTFGKLTMGRQNTLPRDVVNIWGDPYLASPLTTGEGGFTNTNNFKQLIYYTSGGNGANGQGDTRYDQGIVYKRLSDHGLYIGAAYNFGDGNGPGGPNGSGPIPGAEFNKGSSAALATGYNGKWIHGSAFYNTTNVLEAKTIGDTNIGHQAQSWGAGANYDLGRYRLDAGFLYYTADQVGLPHRYDKAWTVSTKFAPTRRMDYELGVQEFYAHNAAVSGSGYVRRPFTDTSGFKTTIDGSRFTVYASVINHIMSNLDLYVVADDLLTGGQYLDSRAQGARHITEIGTGARFRW